MRLITEWSQDNISKHNAIHQFFCYLGTLIISIACFFIERKTLEKETEKTAPDREEPNEQPLIYRREEQINYYLILPKRFLMIIFLWIFVEQLIVSQYFKRFRFLDD